jgi:deoxyribodipyrimidine photo-lyase
MRQSEIQDKRIRLLGEGRRGSGPVVYWMSRDQRAHDNWALLFAQELALRHRTGLAVAFCLVPQFLGAGLRHYMFLLQGLKQLLPEFVSLNIPFRLLEGEPGKAIPGFIEACGAGALVTDFDPLQIKRTWKTQVAEKCRIPFFEVDAHNIVPVWEASPKKEFAAHTLRPKINRLLPEYLVPFPSLHKHPHPAGINSKSLDPEEAMKTIRDRSVPEITWLQPGAKAGHEVLRTFIRNRLARYPDDRNNPGKEGQSNLSPYLHYGQLSPQRAALEVASSGAPAEAREAFLEELIVRRELADNFCHYEPAYDRFEGFHQWARKTLDAHRRDRREYIYSREDLDRGRTHDPLWNACQRDLVQQGKLHGYLRMYWAKKILEWTPSPEEALRDAVYLNDRYSLDGRDPNGYTGIAWSIGGVHDRAWAEREVFGKIRYMSYQGCRRKFDVGGYIARVETGRR